VELLVLWPILCLDNFFNNPDQVIELSKKLKFNKSTGKFPGERTDSLHLLNKEFFLHTTQKIITCLYPNEIQNIQWTASQYFQKINSNKYQTPGFVHQDIDYEFTSIIYLTDNPTSGTCFYKKLMEATPKSDEMIEAKYRGYSNLANMHSPSFKEALEINNKAFEKTIEFKAIKNRMILFDGGTPHGVENFGQEDEERLTLITFFESISRNDGQPLKFPVSQCKRY
jgi:hypothetical protein